MREISSSVYDKGIRMNEVTARNNQPANQVDKLNYLKNHLHAQSAGHTRRLTEVRMQNEERLNSIRRMLDQASTKPSFPSDNLVSSTYQARGTRRSEPVTPAPEKEIPQQDQNEQEYILPYVQTGNIPKSSHLNQIHNITKFFEGESKHTEDSTNSSYSINKDKESLENLVSYPLSDKPKSNLLVLDENAYKLTTDGILSRQEFTPKLAKKAGHLAIAVLKNYYADNGQFLVEQPRNEELHDRIDELNEAKLKADELVGSLQERLEDLSIEIKGLINERKDTKRRHDEEILAYQKKYESQVRAHRERIADLDRKLEKSYRRSHGKNSVGKWDEAKPSVPVHKNKISTQFDQVIPALFSLHGGNGGVDNGAWISEAGKEASKPNHERTDSRDGQEIENPEERVQQLQDQVHKLEIELESWRSNMEEMKKQYTLEKSRRLNVMWSLDAKSRQVKNLLSVEEKHSQLIVKFNNVMMANVMLRNHLEGKTGRTFDNGASMKKALARLDQTKEEKFALLKDSNTEILRLRGILKRAVQRHPDLKDIVECPVDDFNNLPGLSRIVSPFALGNTHIVSVKDKHTRSQTVNVNVPSPMLGRYPANQNSIDGRAKTQRAYRKFHPHSVTARNDLGVVEEDVNLGYGELYSAYRQDEDISYRGKESADG